MAPGVAREEPLPPGPGTHSPQHREGPPSQVRGCSGCGGPSRLPPPAEPQTRRRQDSPSAPSGVSLRMVPRARPPAAAPTLAVTRTHREEDTATSPRTAQHARRQAARPWRLCRAPSRPPAGPGSSPPSAQAAQGERHSTHTSQAVTSGAEGEGPHARLSVRPPSQPSREGGTTAPRLEAGLRHGTGDSRISRPRDGMAGRGSGLRGNC